MYPVYRYTDSFRQPYSHPRSYAPYTHHYYPGWEAVPQQMKIDPSEAPSNYKSYPNTSCFGYSNPSECHGCCNHGYPPGFYSLRPPHPYSPQPPAVYYHGAYTPYPEAFPAYFIPPHYPPEHAACKYDGSTGREHCCGCPNQSPNGRVERNVRIEEEKPDAEHEEKDYRSTGIMKPQNHPYPLFWFPPSYTNNQESSKQSQLPDPKGWNGCVPLDLNSFKPSMRGAEEKRNKNQQKEDEMRFPFPIIWMPGHDTSQEVEKKDVKDINSIPKNPEEPPKSRIIPVKLLENGDPGEKPGVAEEAERGGDSSLASEKETINVKTTTSKQGGKSREKDSETASKSIPVKQIEGNREKKPAEERREKQPSDINGKKASKLPPICLRVDPLPKKQNDSRSPCPPCVNDGVQKDSKSKESIQDKKGGEATNKNQQSPVNKSDQPSRTKEVVQDAANKEAPNKKDIKVIKVQDKENQEEVLKEKNTKASEIDGNKLFLSNEAKQEAQAGKGASVEVEKEIITESMKGEPKVQDGTDTTTGVVLEKSNTETEEAGAGKHTSDGGIGGSTEGKSRKETSGRKKELSSTDAAAIIQAAYRGFEVRKWEPVKKMKRIAKIDDQIADIKERIEKLVTCGDLQLYEKEKLVISETVMNLLLQLDTIQGLHPSVREFRKSVAKELVSLQEKLDSLAAQKTGRPTTTVPESVPSQTVSESCPESAEDSNLSTTAAQFSPESEASVNLTMVRKAISEEDVKQTAVNKKQQHGDERVETDSLCLVEEGRNLEPQSASEDRTSTSVSEQCMEHLAVGNGSLDAATEALVESLPSADKRAVPLETIAPEVKEKIDPGADGSIQDEACVLAVEQQAVIPSIQKDGDPLSEAVLSEGPKAEPRKDEEPLVGEKSIEPQSADDIKAELHDELLEGRKNLNLFLGCKQTSSANDSSEDLAMLAPAESLERKVEPELGIRGQLEATESTEKVDEDKPMTDVEMETSPQESLAEATGNDVSERPPETDMRAEFNVQELPILSEIIPGFDLAPDGLLQHPEVDSSNAVSQFKDVEKPDYEGGKLVGLEIPVGDTQNAIVAEEMQDKLLKIEVAEKEAAEAENMSASAAIRPDELDARNKLPESLKFSNGIAGVVESPVSELYAVPVANQLESPVSKTLKALETQDGPVKLEAAGARIVDVRNRCSEVADVISEVPFAAEMGEGIVASHDVQLRKKDEKAMGTTEDLKEMLEKLIEAGKEQLTVISVLNDRVRDLEKKIVQKKKLKGKKRSVLFRPSCMKDVDAGLKGRAAATAV